MRPSLSALGIGVLSLTGLGLAAYLTYLHLALLQGQIVESAACGGVGSAFDCHAAIASPMGTVFGLPLSLWGILGYLATLSLAFVGWQWSEWTELALRAILTVALLFIAIDTVLLGVMLLAIRSLCVLCLLTYAVNLALAWCAKRGLPQPWPEVLRQAPAALVAFLPRSRVPATWIVWGIVLSGAAGVAAVQGTATFLTIGSPARFRFQMAEYIRSQERVEVNTSGDPMVGARDGPIQIVEFSDYLCGACRQAAEFNRILLAGRRQAVSLVLKHYPLDQACNPNITQAMHTGACQMAAATECAHEQGKFWAFHDLIFGQRAPYSVANLEQDAIRLGLNVEAFRECLASGRGLAAVQRDLEEAHRVGVRSTPTYIINGVRMVGSLPPARFDALLKALRESER